MKCMKHKGFFKSIYAKFAFTYLMLWWFLNSLTFGIIERVLSRIDFPKLSEEHKELFNKVIKVRMNIRFAFLLSALIGTIVILIVVRSIVRPIKRLSKASKEVAKGNFDVEVKVTSKDEIGQLTSDFNLMAKELKNIEFLRKDFVSNVSHEFKTPITSIKGFAKLIKSGKISNEQLMEYCETIEKESERLSLLSSNLLKLSELDSKVIREKATVFSLDEQIRKSILILEPLWSRKNIDLDIELEEVTYGGDENLFQQVWLNLIQNAIKFTNQDGSIKVSLRKTDGLIRIDIEDNGIGIADEDKARIFERFFKGDKSRSKDGTGLGLAIVKKIVELSNGKISFTSQLGKGTIFTVELPPE